MSPFICRDAIINPETWSAQDFFPGVAAIGTNEFMVTWGHHHTDVVPPGIYARRVRTQETETYRSVAPIGDPILVPTSGWGSFSPRIDSDPSGDSYIIHRDGLGIPGNSGITKLSPTGDAGIVSLVTAGCQFTTEGVACSPGMRYGFTSWPGYGCVYPTCSVYPGAFRPSIAAWSNGIIAAGEFMTSKFGPDWTYDPHYWTMDSLCNGLTFDWLQADTPFLYGCGHADVACDSTGNFVVTWMSHIGNNPDAGPTIVYHSRNGGLPISVGTGSPPDCVPVHKLPRVAMDSAGNYIIAWEDNRDGGYSVYAQRYNAAGEAQGENFLVGRLGGYVAYLETFIYLCNGGCSQSQRPPRIYPKFDIGISNATGNFIIAWTDNFLCGVIRAKFYDSSGIELAQHTIPCYYGINANPAVAIDDSNNVLICWNDYRRGNLDVYARSFYLNDLIPNYQESNARGSASDLDMYCQMPNKNVVMFHSPDSVGRK